ncbi:MAG TPA: methylamine dehydrogenase accessory protein MauD [Steroidobacteraceae bacterium]|nr:methylamine dehydrogenase accessory protein MauD [Steroidobacteraceae bacterium]
MNFVIASQIALWIAVLALALLCLALARQIGVLHERLAPAGALALKQALQIGDPAPLFALTDLDGDPVQIGGAREGRGQLLLFISPDCPVCESLLPAIRSAQGAERKWLDVILASDGESERHRMFAREKGLAKFHYVLSEQLGRAFGVAKLPYAVLIDEAGRFAAAGLVNSREHLESLFVAKEYRVGNLQQYLQERGRITASTGEWRG